MQITKAQPPSPTVSVQTGTKLNFTGQNSATGIVPPQASSGPNTELQGTVAAPQAADPKMAALAKREMFIRDQQRKNELKEAELKAKEESFSSDNYIPKHKLIESPYQTLIDSGVPYDKVTEQALAVMGNADPVKQLVTQLQAEIADLKKNQTEAKTAEEQKTTEAYQQVIKQIGSDVKQAVDANAEFETIKAWNAYGAVVKLIEEDFKKTGVVLSVSQACKEVEDVLLEQSLLISKAPKVQSKLAEAVQAAQPKTSEAQPVMKSVSNSVSVNSRPLSQRERAIAAFKGQAK